MTTLTRYFATTAEGLQDSNKQAYICDELGLSCAKACVRERGHQDGYQEQPLEMLCMDLGGSIFQDDPVIKFEVQGVRCECYAVHLDTILGALQMGMTYSDRRDLSGLPCWCGVMVMVATTFANALIPALEAKQVEASRLANESLIRKEKVFAKINENGEKARTEKRSHHPVDSDN
jgi:hypothetical protein